MEKWLYQHKEVLALIATLVGMTAYAHNTFVNKDEINLLIVDRLNRIGAKIGQIDSRIDTIYDYIINDKVKRK